MKVLGLTPEIIYGWNALLFADTAVFKRTGDYYWSFVKFSKTSERLRYFPNKYSYEADVSPLEVVHISTTELAYKVEQRSI